jgi:hypothetical protein
MKRSGWKSSKYAVRMMKFQIHSVCDHQLCRVFGSETDRKFRLRFLRRYQRYHSWSSRPIVEFVFRTLYFGAEKPSLWHVRGNSSSNRRELCSRDCPSNPPSNLQSDAKQYDCGPGPRLYYGGAEHVRFTVGTLAYKRQLRWTF